MMKKTLIERMQIAASHLSLCCDQEFEEEQLRSGANALEMLREWMRETDWLHFVDDHPEAIDWFPRETINEHR